jgi:hypothetical protein
VEFSFIQAPEFAGFGVFGEGNGNAPVVGVALQNLQNCPLCTEVGGGHIVNGNDASRTRVEASFDHAHDGISKVSI